MLKTILKDDRGGQLLLSLLLVVGFTIPALNLLVPQGHFLHVETYTITLLGKYLTYALLALAVDLVWGISRYLEPWAWCLLCLGGLCHGDVSHASDWRPWCVWRPGAA